MTLMSYPGPRWILIRGPVFEAGPPQGPSVVTLALPFTAHRELQLGSQSVLSLSQVTPWPTTMADPSPPLTRTQTRPSPTVPCPTRGLSGTRTATAST